MATVILLNGCADNLWFTTMNAIVLLIADRRIAGMHITLLTSIGNYVQFVHKFYIFGMVEVFGLFAPQFVLMCFCVIFCASMKDKMYALDNVPFKDWMVDDKLLIELSTTA